MGWTIPRRGLLVVARPGVVAVERAIEAGIIGGSVVTVVGAAFWFVEIVGFEDAEHDVVGMQAPDPICFVVILGKKLLHKFSFFTEGSDRESPDFLVEKCAISGTLLNEESL